MTAEECRAVTGPDLLQWMNLIFTVALGIVGACFVYRQNKILTDQSKIFEKQNEFNNKLLEIQNRADKKERLINRTHHAGIMDADLDKLVEDLLNEGIHYSEVAGFFRTMRISTESDSHGLRTLKKIEESFKRSRSKIGIR